MPWEVSSLVRYLIGITYRFEAFRRNARLSSPLPKFGRTPSRFRIRLDPLCGGVLRFPDSFKTVSRRWPQI